ncbi:hypothetical protein [Thiobacillus denitrificans]|uniref:Uncharacterized protein n=1 Tax=Thiobacillus denitrificans TaxID=36861 RepID=A0A106BM67_THIDE|nr:hypothetical protein [Thiobacillus denitrificans]KVW94977.1 hypothetical protein ABW22_11095 [Thiobacillus denitrificans]
MRDEGKLGFVPDYMGDDPENVKRGLRKAFLKHLRERELTTCCSPTTPPGSAAPGPASRHFWRI